MARVLFNNITSPSNIVVFDQCPAVITVEEESYGSNAVVNLNVGNVTAPTQDGQYRLTVMGETVTNVLNPSNANGKRFKVYSDSLATASSIASALRNCQRLVSLFRIYCIGSIVAMDARSIGAVGVTASSNAPGITAACTEGRVFSQLYGTKIMADVIIEGNYKTTLEKRLYGEECSFDVSQVLYPYSMYGSIVPFDISLNAVDTSGVFVNVGNVSGYTTPGYLLKGSSPYLYMGSPQILVGSKEGLTIYGDVLQLSVLSENGYSLNYEVLAPDGTVLEGSEESVSKTGLTDFFLSLTQNALTSGSVINVSAGTDTAQFRIIKPLRAAAGYERLCWRNEYGGVSFFDFTGSDSNTFSMNKRLYNKSWFDFYSNPSFEHEKMIDDGTRTETQLRSHLLTKDEAKQFMSLSRASSVWLAKKEYDDSTERDELTENRRHVILSSVDVVENDTYPGVYTVTVKVKYSSEN